jgi:hypothetical protein
MQVQAARELLQLVAKCLNGADLTTNDDQPQQQQQQQQQQQRQPVNQQHALICALYELSSIVRTLGTSASVLVDACLPEQRLVDRVCAALIYTSGGNNGAAAVRCASSWCLRTLASSLPATMTPLLDTCLDRLSVALIRQQSDAILGYGYACAALLGAISECPLGVPNLMPKLAFNTGEEALRSASQSTNLALAEQKTATGWLLVGACMRVGSNVARKHLPRLRKLWTLTFATSTEQLDAEKRRGDSHTWALSLESRAGALASIHAFLTHCPDLITSDQSLLNALMRPIDAAVMLLGQLPAIVKQNGSSVALRAKSATFRLRLYQTLIALPNPSLYESHYGVILGELVAEFTQADAGAQSAPTVVTSTLRSICHTNEAILFGNTGSQQDHDYKLIEDQLQQQFSASGSEALEHDTVYLYQRLGSVNHSINSNLAYNQAAAALPLGVAVIDSAIQLYGLMYPRIPNKHRLQILNHFIELIQKQPASTTATSNTHSTAAVSLTASKQALQINIFTAVLGSLKHLAETKCELGDDGIRRATLRLVMDTLCHSNSLLRCAAGEALGRLAQVIGESAFIVAVASNCFDALKRHVFYFTPPSNHPRILLFISLKLN